MEDTTAIITWRVMSRRRPRPACRVPYVVKEIRARYKSIGVASSQQQEDTTWAGVCRMPRGEWNLIGKLYLIPVA